MDRAKDFQIQQKTYWRKQSFSVTWSQLTFFFVLFLSFKLDAAFDGVQSAAVSCKSIYYISVTSPPQISIVYVCLSVVLHC